MSFNNGPLHYAIWKLHVLTSEKSIRDQTTVKFMAKETCFLEKFQFSPEKLSVISGKYYELLSLERQPILFIWEDDSQLSGLSDHSLPVNFHLRKNNVSRRKVASSTYGENKCFFLK